MFYRIQLDDTDDEVPSAILEAVRATYQAREIAGYSIERLRMGMNRWVEVEASPESD